MRWSVGELIMKTGRFEEYDRQRVVAFASRTTQLDPAIVSAVLCVRDLYRQSVGVDQPRTPLDEELAASMRTKYPALFPADVLHVHFVSPRLQREFIMSEANVDETVVRRVLHVAPHDREKSTPSSRPSVSCAGRTG